MKCVLIKSNFCPVHIKIIKLAPLKSALFNLLEGSNAKGDHEILTQDCKVKRFQAGHYNNISTTFLS